jgi:hypothetical protein
VGELHGAPEFAGALFQVASQFNLLEMIGPEVTPEDGVTRYYNDPTQCPACAIAAGAATLYRNYFLPVGGQIGQTRDRQIDCLADVGNALVAELGGSLGTCGQWKTATLTAIGRASRQSTHGLTRHRLSSWRRCAAICVSGCSGTSR